MYKRRKRCGKYQIYVKIDVIMQAIYHTAVGGIKYNISNGILFAKMYTIARSYFAPTMSLWFPMVYGYCILIMYTRYTGIPGCIFIGEPGNFDGISV